MSMFRRKGKRMPELNTASLPDLIFTILFFFLIVTHMRHDEIKVKYETPKGKKLEKLARRSSTSYIYIGRPTDNLGNVKSEEMAIQLNDKLVTLNDISHFIANERRTASDEDLNRMVVDIKADKNVKMGLITDIKQLLRKQNALKIRYSAQESNED